MEIPIKRMKIGLIGLALPPIMGGVETYNWELARHLRKRGHEVYLFGIKNYKGEINPEYEYVDGIHIYRVSKAINILNYRFWEFAQVQIASKIIKLHKEGAFDLLHAQAVFPPGLAAYLASKIVNIPYLITSHGIEIMLWSKNRIYQKWRKLIIKIIFRKASRIIAVSNELRDLSIDNGANPNNVVSYSNATDFESFYPEIDGNSLREELGFKPNEIVILSLRRLVPKNGVQYLVDIAKIVLQNNINIRFLICGDGPLFESMTKRVIDLNLENMFKMVGSIPNSKIPKYIAASNIAVFPSLAEATSIACLECMAQGKPVITSNVGGLPEIVEHGKNGLLVDFIRTNSSFIDYGLSFDIINNFAQQILFLSENTELQNEFGVYASKYVRENHTWDKYMDKITVLYNIVLEH